MKQKYNSCHVEATNFFWITHVLCKPTYFGCTWFLLNIKHHIHRNWSKTFLDQFFIILVSLTAKKKVVSATEKPNKRTATEEKDNNNETTWELKPTKPYWRGNGSNTWEPVLLAAELSWTWAWEAKRAACAGGGSMVIGVSLPASSQRNVLLVCNGVTVPQGAKLTSYTGRWQDNKPCHAHACFTRAVLYRPCVCRALFIVLVCGHP